MKFSLGLFEVILIVNIILKLVGISMVATWSWTLVLWPLWVDAAVLVVAIVIFFLTKD